MLKKGNWKLALVFTVVAGLSAAVAMTFYDWRLNPGGLFHDASGTNWPVVIETALSWFLPVTGLAAVLAIVTIVLWSRRK